jgi:hypothetical protein
MSSEPIYFGKRPVIVSSWLPPIPRSNSLLVKGLRWKILTHYKLGTIFVHRNIWVVFDKDANIFRAQNSQGRLLFARAHSYECLRDASDCILEVYASQFRPIWKQL